MTEADVAKQCDELAEVCGWTVERYEQRRASRICAGLPDRRYVHAARRFRVWVELKAPKGKLTRDQRIWLLSELDAGGVATVVDDVKQLAQIFARLTQPRVGNTTTQYCRDLVQLVAQRGYRAA